MQTTAVANNFPNDNTILFIFLTFFLSSQASPAKVLLFCVIR